MVINYESSLVSGMYKLEEVCYLTTSVAAIHFFYGSVFMDSINVAFVVPKLAKV